MNQLSDYAGSGNMGNLGASQGAHGQATQYDPNRLSAAELASLGRTNTHGEAQQLEQEAAARAWALRNTGMPQGYSQGGIFHASSPLEALAAGMERAQGQQQLQGAVGQQHANLAQQQQDIQTQAPRTFAGQQQVGQIYEQILPFLFGR